MERYKTTSQKSCPDILNFHVDLAGQEKINDASGATICRLKFKGPSISKKVQKLKDISKTGVSQEIRLKISDGRKQIDF